MATDDDRHAHEPNGPWAAETHHPDCGQGPGQEGTFACPTQTPRVLVPGWLRDRARRPKSATLPHFLRPEKIATPYHNLLAL